MRLRYDRTFQTLGPGSSTLPAFVLAENGMRLYFANMGVGAVLRVSRYGREVEHLDYRLAELDYVGAQTERQA